jgi:hypothetical protein
MNLKLNANLNISGSGLLLSNLKLTIIFLQLAYQRSQICCTQHFLSDIVDKHDRQPVSLDGGMWHLPQQACHFLKLKHHLHSFYKKSILKEQSSSKLKIGTKNVLTITFHTVKRKNVN